MNLSPLRIVIQGIDQYSKETAKMQKSMQQMAVGMRSTGEKMSTFLTLPIVAAGGYAVAQIAKFDDALADVEGTTGATAAQMAALNKTARSMVGLGVGPLKAAEGMKELGRAGFSVQEQLEAIGPMMKAASAGSMELADAAGLVDSMMDVWAINTSELSGTFDMLFLTSTKSATGFKDMAGMLSTLGPVFRQMGMPMEDAMVVIRGFNSAGVDLTAGVASLSRAMVMLNNPTKSATDGFRRLGLSKKDFFGGNGKLLGITDIVDKLAKSGATAADVYQIFGDKVGKNFAPLISQGADTLKTYRAELDSAGGSMDNLINKKMSGMGGVLKRAGAALELVSITIGERLAPTFLKLWSAVEPAIMAFANLPAPAIGIVIGFAAIVAAAGPLLVVAATIISSFATIAGAIAGAGGVIALLCNPVVLAVVAVVALVSMLVLLGDTMKPLYGFIGGAFGVVFAVLGAFISPLIAGFSDLWQAFKGLLTTLQPLIIAFLSFASLPIVAFLAPFLAIGYALVWVFRLLAWVIKTSVDGWNLLFKAVGDFFGMIDKAMGGPVAGLLKALGDIMGSFTGKKTEIAVTGTPAMLQNTGLPSIGGVNAAGAAGLGSMAGMAAFSAPAGAQAEPTKITIDFKNVPTGISISQTGKGAKVTGYNGPIMAGAM